MTRDEANAAATALIDWFTSQDISPWDSIKIIAILLNTIYTGVEELTEEAD